MNVLVTGATGFLGSHLTRALVREGHQVVALKRGTSSLARLEDVRESVRFYDIEQNGVERALSEHIAAVVHTATCYGRAGESDLAVFEANTRFPLLLLDKAARRGVPMFLNADTCFHRQGGTRYRYLQSYTLSKRQFLEWGREFGLAGRIRFVNVELQHPYGPGDSPSKFVGSMIRDCLAGGEIRLTPGEQRKDFVYVDDVVSAFLLLLDLPDRPDELFEQYECGSGRAVSVREFVETIHRVTQSQATLRFGALPYRENEIMYSCADTAELQRLGWRPRCELDEGIRRIVQADFAAEAGLQSTAGSR